jgi:hypothetical protein
MTSTDAYKEFIEFVNDDFNWNNTTNNLSTGVNQDQLKGKLKELYWIPKNLESPYLMNSMGYRSDEFIENRDIVFTGCSQTWGQGVVYEGIWGNILSKSLGLKSYNLGLGGQSVSSIVKNFIGFCEIYGKPKAVFCLFPEFTRMEMRSNKNHMVGRNHIPSEKLRIKYPLVPNIDPNSKAKYSKAPHIAEDIIPSELAFSISIDQIRMLELYCKLNGIKLFWGTWDVFQESYLKENVNKMVFNNYVYLQRDKWVRRKYDDYLEHFHDDVKACYNNFNKKCDNLNECHQEYREYYGKNFDIAMDSDPHNKAWGHMPVHIHKHIAEYFEEAFKNDKD